MKLQPEVKKEFIRIACGTAVCTAVMWVIFSALHLALPVPFDYRVILGSLAGDCVAVLNFYGLCVSVQRATAEQDEKRRKMRVQTSYNARMLMQAVWIVIAITAPCFQVVAGVAPLLFPRITIYYLQITGKYKPASSGESVSVEVDETNPAGPTEEVPAGKGGETE